LPRMSTEQTRRSKLTELVTDHVFRHVHRDELVPVVHREGVTDKVRNDRARARPGLDDLLCVRRIHSFDFLHERVLNDRPLLYASRHLRFPVGYCVALPRFLPRTIRRCDGFFLLRVFTPSFLPHGLTTLRPPRVRPPCG